MKKLQSYFNFDGFRVDHIDHIVDEVSEKDGVVSTDEIGLKITKSNMILPCGVYGRWECNEENS